MNYTLCNIFLYLYSARIASHLCDDACLKSIAEDDLIVIAEESNFSVGCNQRS